MDWKHLARVVAKRLCLAATTGARDRTERFESDEIDLIAYQVLPTKGLTLDVAPRDRSWIDKTQGQFAYRCLPMLIANQSGWIVRNSHRVVVEWNGGDDPGDVTITIVEGPPDTHIVSLFGYGIVTWRIPFLFRTSRGINILTRGPANWPKHGAQALEGVVEADWAVATFTMNWKLTRPGEKVLFEIGEPICMVVPQRRGDLGQVRPTCESLDACPELKAEYLAWRNSRRAFVRTRTALTGAERFQRHYLRGVTLSGDKADVHQVKLGLKPFAKSKVRQ